MLWVYLVANLAGGAAAAFAFRAINADDLGADTGADAGAEAAGIAEAEARYRWHRAALEASALTAPDAQTRQPVGGDHTGP
jgi:hypothetical protein